MVAFFDGSHRGSAIAVALCVLVGIMFLFVMEWRRGNRTGLSLGGSAEAGESAWAGPNASPGSDLNCNYFGPNGQRPAMEMN